MARFKRKGPPSKITKINVEFTESIVLEYSGVDVSYRKPKVGTLCGRRVGWVEGRRCG